VTSTPTPTWTATAQPTAIRTVVVEDANWVAVDSVQHTVFVTSRSTAKVFYLDPTTLAVDGSIDVGDAPFGLAANPANRLLYVANYGSGSVSIINMDTLAVIATHLTGGGPTFVAVDSATGKAYAPLHPTNRVARFLGTIYLGSFATRGDQVFAVALDGQASPKRLYVANRGRFSAIEVYNADTAAPTYSASLAPGGEIYNVAVDQNTGNLYVMHTFTNDNNVRFMTVYSRAGVKLTAQPLDIGINTFDGGGLGMVTSSGRVYVAGTECVPGTIELCAGYAPSGAVVVVQGAPPALITRLDDIPDGPFGVAVDDSLQRVYVTINDLSLVIP
jgi:YVTN family beta-propeller protein